MTIELWAARDADGSLWLFFADPEWFPGGWWRLSDGTVLLHGPADVPLGLLTDLQPGEKCRVELRLATESMSDGEPITEDSLKSIGFFVHPTDDLILMSSCKRVATYCVSGLRLWRVNNESIPPSATPQTIGDVRRLVERATRKDGE